MRAHGLDPVVVRWIEAFAGPSARFGSSAVSVSDGELVHEFAARRDGRHEVRFRERGDPVRVLMSGGHDAAQTYFVWRLASDAQWRTRQRVTDYPIAPERVPAEEGPFQVRPGTTGSGEILVDGDPIATFETLREAVEFTHYGAVPVDLLIEQIMGPPESMIFPAGARYRTDEEQRAEGRLIRTRLDEALARREEKNGSAGL